MLYAPTADNSLWEYCVRRGWQDEDVRVFGDAGILRAVRAGKVEIILGSNLNGLARSSLELVELLREFVSRKITLIIPNQRIDTSKVPRQAFLGMLDAIEEFKLSATVESIRAGLAAARKRGARLGRPQTVNPHRGDVARLRAQGLTGRAIAKELGIPSSTVFKLIKGTALSVSVSGGAELARRVHSIDERVCLVLGGFLATGYLAVAILARSAKPNFKKGSLPRHLAYSDMVGSRLIA